MITCNRCGSISPASAVNCQNCGAPLASNVETGLSQRGFQEQPELPAWLESLRAGERPAAPTDNPANFSTADLIEEGSLPSWMRSGRPEMNDTSLSSPHIPLRPSSLPGPNTDDSKGINAKSLIDENFLPSWMQENKQPTNQVPEGGIAASSLLQKDLMPDWMRSLQQSPSASNPAMPSARQMPLPAPAFPEQPVPSPMPERSNDESRSAQGFSARDLVDQGALPQWMVQQDKKGPAPVQPGPTGTISPSSLVDVNSLPPWLQESAQQGQKSGALPPAQPNQSWQSAQSPFGQSASLSMQPGSPVWQPSSPQLPPLNNAPVQGGGLAASSFIDPNALPEWMRSGTEQQKQSGGMPAQWPPATNARSGSTVPPRVENVRVPSRPRGEVNANESNEAAANVFASMLGVASTAPNFPGSPPPQGYGMQSGGFGQGVSASPTQVPPPASNTPGMITGTSTGFTGPQSMQRPQQGQGYTPGGAYQTTNQGSGNYLGGNAGMSPYAAGGQPNGMSADSGQKTSKPPAKKGIVDMIRDWFR